MNKKEKTWMQYWPKVQAIVAWLSCNATTPEGMFITEAKFLQFLIHLKDGSFYREGNFFCLADI